MPKMGFSKSRLSLEVISTYEDGIIYVVSCPDFLSQALVKQLVAYWPKLEITRIRHNFLPTPNNYYKVTDWRVRHQSSQVEDSKPLNYLLSSMSDLKKAEVLGLQFIISTDNGPTSSDIFLTGFKILKAILKFSIFLIFDALTGSVNSKNDPFNRIKKTRLPKQHDASSFKCSIRTLVVAKNEKRLESINLAFEMAVRSYDLVTIKSYVQPLQYNDFIARHPRFYHNRLTSFELARLYYFPEPTSDLTKDLVVKHSANLGLSTQIKPVSPQDLIIGKSLTNESDYIIGLKNSARQKHLLIIGGTGMGKSTMIANCLIQDILANKGVALIDPHGDLALDIIGYIPKARIKDVVYIDPTDVNFPVGLNLMELPSGLSLDQLEIAKDLITESIVSMFRKIFSEEDSGGHRIEYILRNTIHTALIVPDATLFTLHKLLTNDLFRAGVVSKLDDNSLKDFWYGEFNKAGSYQRVKMISGVTAKLGRFQRSVVIRRMIEQPKSTINFDNLINENKIVICNFAKGRIGEDSSALLSMAIMAKIQLSVWRRSLVESNKRIPFYLYLDEFQNFASPSLIQLISESRKFGLYLTMAEQTMAYQDTKDINILLANVGNIVCFRTASLIDGTTMESIFHPYVTANDLYNLKPYSFYMRLSSEITQEPISGITIPIKTQSSSTVAKQVIDSSRRIYAHKYRLTSKEMDKTMPEKSRVPMSQIRSKH